MRNPTTLQLSGATKPDNGKSSQSFTTNNMWKMLLLFVVVALLNTVYITRVVLAPEEANQRFDLQLVSSFIISGPTNSSSWQDAFDDAMDDKTLEEPVKMSPAEMEAVKRLQHPIAEKLSSDVIVNKVSEEAVDKNLVEKDVLVAVNNNNSDEKNLVQTTAEKTDLHIHWPKTNVKNLDVKNLIKKQSKVNHINDVEEEENADENEDGNDEDENENDDEDENEDEDDHDEEDGNDNGEENDTDTENEADDNTPEEHGMPVKLTNAEHAMVQTFSEHNSHVLKMNKRLFNTISRDADGEIEIQYRPRIKPKQKKKKRKKKKRRRNKIHNVKRIGKTYSPEQKLFWKPKDTAIAPNVTNDEYYKDIPAEFLVEDPSLYLWDRPEMMIPEWMKDYFRWHRWKRSTWKDKPTGVKKKSVMTNSTELQWWEKERWLISQCLMSMDSKKCGGTADRLKPIPVLLRVAYENKRVFLIRWTRPSHLEEFLMPPVGGFDWRLPPELNDVMDDHRSGKRLPTRKLILEYAAGGLALVRARYQTGTPSRSYNELVFGDNAKKEDIKKFGFDSIFSRVWKLMFTPTVPIQKIVQSKLSTLGLVPNQYVASHLRALYAVEARPPQEVRMFTKNALACATTIFTGVPIFFASDSPLALETAHGFDGQVILDPKNQSMTLKVLTAADVPTPSKNKGNNTQPWHLDSYIGPIENFYDTFVDLYMLAMGGCVTYGKGGYGNWASLIGGHLECQRQQALPGKRIKDPETQLCKFNATSKSYESIISDFQKRFPSTFGKGDAETGPLFLPPMD